MKNITKAMRLMLAAVLALIIVFGAAAETFAATADGNKLTVWQGHFTYTVTYNGNTATVSVTKAQVEQLSSSAGYINNGNSTTFKTQIYLGSTLKKASGNSSSVKFTKVGQTFNAPTVSATIDLTTGSQTVQLRIVNNASGKYSYANITVGRKRQLTINYNVNGGTVTNTAYNAQSGILYKGTTKSATTILYGNTADTINVTTPGLTRTGYHFEDGKEWNTKADGSGTSFDHDVAYAPGKYDTGFNGSADRTVTLYANWKVNAYTISFLPGADDTVGSVNSISAVYGRSYTLPECAFVRPGYRFAGWKFGNGTFDSGATVSNLTALHGGTVTMAAVWKEISESEADIVVGKVLESGAATGSFRFSIEAVEAMHNDNESTRESGTAATSADIPMPAGTMPGEIKQTIEISDVRRGELSTKSFGLITFDTPGWYMYRISEADDGAAGVKYDDTSYYAVVYVEYEDETSGKVRVSNITAWHNNAGSSKVKPNLSDISEETDNGGREVLSNDSKGIFGKVGMGTNSLAAYKFWNSASAASFRLQKNVTGSLGDTTKKFEFRVEIMGLGLNQSYPVIMDGAEPVSGIYDNLIVSDGSGNSSLLIRLSDDDSFEFENVPLGAAFTVTESASDHAASYTVTRGTDQIAGAAGTKSGSGLSSGKVTVNTADTYTVLFTNHRDIAVNTGLPEYLPIAGMTFASLCLLVVLLAGRKRGRK